MFLFFLSFHSYSKIIDISTITEESFPSQFNLVNRGVNASILNEDIAISQVWKSGNSGEGSTIFVIDYGTYLEHSDFKDKINTDFNSGYKQATKFGASTRALGAAAAAINGKGTVGAAPDAKVAANTVDISKTYSPDEYGKLFYGPAKGKCIILHPNQVISNPFAGTDYFPDDPFTNIKISAAGDDGAKGGEVNHFVETCSIMSLTVGASTNRGEPTYYTNKGSCISVVAPSNGLKDDLLIERKDHPLIPITDTINDGYKLGYGGTAFAAGEVAGVVAMMLNANPNLNFLAVETILKLSATHIDPNSPLWVENSAKFKYHPYLGFGRVNATLAVELAKTFSAPELGVSASSGSTSVPEIGIQVQENDKEEPYPIKMEVEVSDEGQIIYSELVLNIEPADLTNTRIAIKQKDGKKIEILSPSDYSPSTDNIYKVTNEDKSHVRIGFKQLFGEKVANSNDIYINRIDGKSSILYSIEITHFTANEFTFPTVEKSQAVDPKTDSTTKSSKISIEIPASTLTAGNEYNFKVTKNDKPDASNAIYLMDESGNVMPLSLVKPENGEIELRMPSTLKTAKYALGVMLSGLIERVTDYFTLQNSEKSQVLFPKKDSIVNIRFDLTWASQKDTIGPLGHYGKVLVTVSNKDTGAILYSKYFPDTGYAYIENINAKLVNTAEVSIIPVIHGEVITSSTFTIYDDQEPTTSTPEPKTSTPKPKTSTPETKTSTPEIKTPTPTNKPDDKPDSQGSGKSWFKKPAGIALIVVGISLVILIIILIIVLATARSRRIKKIETSQMINDLLIT